MGNRYAKSQIVLHWLTLLMVILTYAAMLLKDSVPDDLASLVKNLHFNFGFDGLFADVHSAGVTSATWHAGDHTAA